MEKAKNADRRVGKVAEWRQEKIGREGEKEG